MNIKSPQIRATEYASKPTVKRILGEHWLPDKELMTELEVFWTRYLTDNPGKEVGDRPYNQTAKMILGGARIGLYENTQRLGMLQPHTLEHYQCLYGIDLGLAKYKNRSSLISSSIAITDTDDAVDAFFRLKHVGKMIAKSDLSNDQLSELGLLFKAYPRNTFKDCWLLVADLVRYHHPDYVGRFKTCRSCDYHSREYLMARYGNDESKLAELKLKQQADAFDNFSNTPRYWLLRGFDNDAAVLAAHQIQKNRAARAGNKSRGKPCGPRTAHYWISRGHSQEEATKLVSAWQRRDTDWFVTMYGSDEGKVRYNQMIQRRQQTWYGRSDLDRQQRNSTKGKTKAKLIDKYGEERAFDIIRRRTSGTNKISKESVEFFVALDQTLGDLATKSVTGYKGTERFVKFGNNITWVDYYLDGKIIEFHGSYWHADPRLFEADEIHNVINLPCKEVWERDHQRIDMLEKLGYTVLVIWSKDVDDDRQRELDRAKQFILG